MLFLQYPLYRERLYWKISFGAEKIVRFMEYLLCDWNIFEIYLLKIKVEKWNCSKLSIRFEVTPAYV